MREKTDFDAWKELAERVENNRLTAQGWVLCWTLVILGLLVFDRMKVEGDFSDLRAQLARHARQPHARIRERGRTYCLAPTGALMLGEHPGRGHDVEYTLTWVAEGREIQPALGVFEHQALPPEPEPSPTPTPAPDLRNGTVEVYAVDTWNVSVGDYNHVLLSSGSSFVPAPHLPLGAGLELRAGE